LLQVAVRTYFVVPEGETVRDPDGPTEPMLLISAEVESVVQFRVAEPPGATASGSAVKEEILQLAAVLGEGGDGVLVGAGSDGADGEVWKILSIVGRNPRSVSPVVLEVVRDPCTKRYPAPAKRRTAATVPATRTTLSKEGPSCIL
jgi:hypothetical protein